MSIPSAFDSNFLLCSDVLNYKKPTETIEEPRASLTSFLESGHSHFDLGVGKLIPARTDIGDHALLSVVSVQSS